MYRILQFCSPSSRLKKGKRFEGMCSTKTIYKCASSAQRQMCIHFLGNENCICLKSGLPSYLLNLFLRIARRKQPDFWPARFFSRILSSLIFFFRACSKLALSFIFKNMTPVDSFNQIFLIFTPNLFLTDSTTLSSG